AWTRCRGPQGLGAADGGLSQFAAPLVGHVATSRNPARFIAEPPGPAPLGRQFFADEGPFMDKITKILTRTKGTPSALDTPTDLSEEATAEMSHALNVLLADTYALFVKTKNFHWHVSGPHFRSYHLLFDEQAKQLFETTDELAERVRKIGGDTL